MSPEDLPEDVWLSIVRNYISTRVDAAHLGATNKHIFGLALSRLYHGLTVKFDAYDCFSQDDLGAARLLSISRRVQAIQDRVHLLHHVRRLRIIFFRPADADIYDGYTSLWSSTYDAVTSLLFKLSHITALTLDGCIITARLHSYIHHHADALKVLTIRRCWRDPGAQGFLNKQGSLQLEEFHFYNNISPSNSVFQFPTKMLQPSTSSLRSLTIQETNAIGLVGHRLSSLRNLKIHSFSKESRGVSDLLASCPSLHRVEISPSAYTCPPLPNDALPFLESVVGDLRVVCALLPGRPVHHIHILGVHTSPLGFEHTNLLRASTVPVSHLIVELWDDTPSTEEALKQLVSALTHLSYLKAQFCVHQGRLKEITDRVTRLLPGLPQLRLCLLFLVNVMSITQDFVQEYFRPPSGHVSSRGHPTLEELQFDTLKSSFAWLWYPGDGWLLRKFERLEDNYALSD